MAMLRRLVINGFKSIKAMDIELRALNVLIGANGAGKSNLVSFFKMLNEMMAGRLQQHVGTSGRAHSILYFGPKVTPEMTARLEFTAQANQRVDAYEMRLAHAAGDSLVFAEETLLQEHFLTTDAYGLGSGHQETKVGEAATGVTPGMPAVQSAAESIRRLLNQCRVYHFHDTSPTARVRQYCYIGDNRWLMPDASNLAAVLLRLREEGGGAAYRRIVATIRLVAPFFRDFVLEPEGPHKKDLILNWLSDADEVEALPGTGGGDQVFGPHQLSDGTLRAMCLVTLLLQPETELPDLIIVDEPELGLHPYALNLIATLFMKASHHAQVLVSTQSGAFLDNFAPDDVIVASREANESKFTRLHAEQLHAWLEEYSLGEVWEKNVVGGGPH